MSQFVKQNKCTTAALILIFSVVLFSWSSMNAQARNAEQADSGSQIFVPAMPGTNSSGAGDIAPNADSAPAQFGDCESDIHQALSREVRSNDADERAWIADSVAAKMDSEYWQSQASAHQVQARTMGWRKFESYAASQQTDLLELPTFDQMVDAPRSAEHLLIKLADCASPFTALEGLGLAHAEHLGNENLHIFTITSPANFSSVLEQANAHPAVIYAEPDYKIESNDVPNDPGAGDGVGAAWWLEQINAFEAWDYGTDATAVGPIALFDSGVLATHEDLMGNMWVNTGEMAGNGNDDDNNGYVDDVYGPSIGNGDRDHGTKVAGTLCAVGNNGVGYVGAAWKCQIMDIRGDEVFNQTVADAIEALDYAVDNGSRLSNHSWSVSSFSQALADAVAAAESAGHLMVVAAGNNGYNLEAAAKYPARLSNPNIIAVAASAQNESKISYSNFGPQSVDIAAPSEFVSTSEDGSYTSFSGTSQSTPLVTGAIALAWSRVPTWEYYEIRQHVLDNARPSSFWTGLSTSGGILDMEKIMSNLKPDTDGDGILDISDLDDDNDGVPDLEDAFPRDNSETADADNDRIGDNADSDDDNDGVLDADDWQPTNPDEQYDTDGDGMGNNVDPDDDGDGEPDVSDQLPLDATETVDTDGDGVGDNADLLPNDPSESLDSDGDGMGDNADPDADNDGIPDAIEAYNNTDIANWTNNTDAVTFMENSVSFSPYATSPGFNDQINSEKFSTYNVTNDYIVSWRVSSIPNASYSAVGLGISEQGIHYSDIDYAMLNASGSLYIYEGGTEIGGFGTVDVGTKLAIEVTNGTLSYLKDGAVLRTVNLASTPDFYLDISFNSYRGYTGVTYTNFKLEPFGSVDPDVDGDGIINAIDLDSDNDSIPDIVEAGLADSNGDMRVDNSGDAASVANPPDTDDDGVPDYLDLESNNRDNDRTDYDIKNSDYAFFDTSRDGMIDGNDVNGGDDPDGNGVDALVDDTDKNGIMNYMDTDDDGDGVADTNDPFPLDSTETMDSDNDGVGDNGDAFPNDGNETTDTDGDGTGDNADTDDDNDGIPDTVEDEGGALRPDDLDEAIADLLDTSGNAYAAAADGEWVSITKGEYDAFVDSIEGVTRFGTSEANMKTGPFANFGNSNRYTFGQSTNPSPANVHVFAFKAASGNQFGGGDERIRLSPNNNGQGFAQHGANLPNGQVINNEQFYLLKGADNTTFTNAQYLGLTSNESNPSYYNANGTSGRYRLGSVTNPNTFNFGWSMQALAIESLGNGVSAMDISMASEGDSDGDGILDRHDLDSDNDTIPDITEAGLMDEDRNYMVDDPNQAGSVMEPADTDEDGLADYLDIEHANAENDGTDFDIDDGDFTNFDTNNDGMLDNLDAAGGGDVNTNGVDDLIEDNDGDGQNNIVDPDDDNDGVLDDVDAFPFDPNESTDTDGDGVGNNGDAFPSDPNETTDSDNDGVGNNADAFPNDPDETTDSDGDGTGDNADAFPNDPNETADADGDGIGNNADTDSDNDGIPDSVESGGGLADTDGDGVYNQVDLDSDNDSIPDVIEAGFLDNNRDLVVDDLNDQGSVITPPDSDEDGIPNYLDLESANAANDGTAYDIMTGDDAAFDTNGDGKVNDQDTNGGSDMNTNGVDDLLEDNDEDGINDIADPDDDNDGVFDEEDAFPTDPNETMDSDGDGIGDNADAFPNDANETMDSDGDGVGDNGDAFPNDANETMDTDSDGVGDNADDFPNDPSETTDSDNDGVGDNSDVDIDNDGIADITELRTAYGVTSWANAQNGVSVSDNSVTYDGTGGFAWNSQINSAPRSSYGYTDNYRISWRMSGNLGLSNLMWGLGVDETSPGYQDIEYAFYNAGGNIAIYESGSSTGNSLGSIDENDVLAIEVSGGQLTYRLNGTAMRTVPISGNPDLYIDSSFFSGVVTIVDVTIEPTAGLSTDQDGDGVLNTVDLDSDNDTIADVVEAGLVDMNGDFLVDDLANGQASVIDPPDTDSDGLPDYQDLESNNPANDGTAYDIMTTGNASMDSNGDGMVNGDDAQGGTDVDEDGLDDLYDPDTTGTNPPDGMLGDVTCDDVVNAVDALAVLQYVVSIRTDGGSCPLADSGTTLNLSQGDVSADGGITSVDALFLLQCEVGIGNSFCPGVGAATLAPTAASGSVVIEMAQNGNTVAIVMDAENSMVSAGTLVLTYDASIAQMTSCSTVGSGFCNEVTPGEVSITFVDTNGISSYGSIAELAFSSSDAKVTGLSVTTLANSTGKDINYDVVLAQQVATLEQLEVSNQLFIPLVSRRNFKSRGGEVETYTINWACLLDQVLLHSPEADAHPVMEAIQQACNR